MILFYFKSEKKKKKKFHTILIIFKLNSPKHQILITFNPSEPISFFIYK